MESVRAIFYRITGVAVSGGIQSKLEIWQSLVCFGFWTCEAGGDKVCWLGFLEDPRLDLSSSVA